MADVSGKGVPAALFMVIAKTLIKNRAQMGDSPSEILANVNEQLCQGNDAELFVTVWLAVIQLSTGHGVAANAGHEHPVIKRKDGQYELVVYRHSPAVATMDGIRFREHTFELNPGDRLFIYTDGVPEATNSRNELFGTDRMLAALNRDPDADPHDLLRTMSGDIDAFVGGAPQFDDITMLSFQYAGAEGKKLNELTLEAKVENLDEVLAFVDGQLEQVDCPLKTQMQIDVAVEELFVNIAHYAYTPNVGTATIRVDVMPDPKAVAITFIDRGVPYDPLKKPDPDVTLPAEERQIGGLGIYMVKKSMDSMDYEYRDGQNILRILKNLG
jgi:sigma-B regulation protein RsbU (phosphoserine phosphatase)